MMLHLWYIRASLDIIARSAPTILHVGASSKTRTEGAILRKRPCRSPSLSYYIARESGHVQARAGALHTSHKNKPRPFCLRSAELQMIKHLQNIVERFGSGILKTLNPKP